MDVADEHSEDSEVESTKDDNNSAKNRRIGEGTSVFQGRDRKCHARAARDKSEALRYGGSSLARRVINSVELLSKAIHASEGETVQSQ